MLGFVPSATIDLGAPRKAKPRSNTASNIIIETGSPVARTAVSLEYASLRYRGHCPLGIYITPSRENLLVWDAVFFIHQGYYAGAVFKFRLVFPLDYPERAPAVQFLADVFHPLVNQGDGIFNLSPRFRTWRPKEHHAFDVLHWVKASFKKHALDQIREDDAFNREAYRYHEATSSFAQLANQSSMLSQSPSALFSRDHPSMAGKGRHSMTFRELKPEHAAALRVKLGLREWDDEEEAE